MSEGIIEPQWRAWAIENLLRGAAPETLRSELVEAGVPDSAARELLSVLRDNELFGPARALSKRVAALEAMVRLRGAHRGVLPDGGVKVERTRLPDVDAFQRLYWAPGLPVIFTDLVTDWPAFGRWGLTDLVERFGEANITACTGRNDAPHPDVQWRPHARSMTVQSFVTALRSSDANDVYVTTNNAALGHEGLRGLLEDIRLPKSHFGTLDPRFLGLWIGKRTRTLMHHDHANGVLCQVVGRKRVVMVPPDSLEMLETSRGVYNRRDSDADLAEVPGRVDLTLEPGEALFIPTGWWHRVDAEDISMSVSIRKFAWPNAFNWYRPGTSLAGREVPAF